MLIDVVNSLTFASRKFRPRLRWSAYREKAGIRPIAKNKSDLYLWILEQLPSLDSNWGDRVRLLDLGSGDFSYLFGLAEWLQIFRNEISIVGLESDPYRLYSNFYRRGDIAKYYVSRLNLELPVGSYAEYRYGNWLEFGEGNFDCITCFFPFLFLDLHRGAGLPRRFFNPEFSYRKIFRSAKTGIFFHQGQEELEESLRIIKSLNLVEIVDRSSFQENPFLPRKHPIESLSWRRLLKPSCQNI